MKYGIKRLFVISILTCLILTLLAPGCRQPPPVTTPEPLTTGGTSPMEPVTVDLSFPDGAPPLNQTAKLIFIVKAHIFDIKNMSVTINLPEALELVSGNLSWVGNIAKGDEVEVIKAVVKSVKVGNWTIEATSYINPEKHGSYGGNGWYPIYVSISEDSAAWGRTPPWYKGGGFPVPVEPVDPSFAQIKVDLSISDAPALNEVVELTCTVSSKMDVPNTTAQIILPGGATLVSGSLTWQGNLKAGEPVSFSAEIVFKEVGKWTIKGVARHPIDEKTSVGNSDFIYLDVGVNYGAFAEEPVEELPEPPAVSVN